MKVLRLMQKILKQLGIRQPKSPRELDRFNLQNLLYFNAMLAFTASTIYHLREVETFPELTDTLYGTDAFAATSGLFLTIILKSPQIFNIITLFEEIIQKR